MLSTPIEYRLTITDVEQVVVARNAAGEAANWYWNVTASHRDGTTLTFTLTASETPVPGGEVVLRYQAQIILP